MPHPLAVWQEETIKRTKANLNGRIGGEGGKLHESLSEASKGGGSCEEALYSWLGVGGRDVLFAMSGSGKRGGEEMAGRAAAAAKEKTSFAVTCSLLGQYLKEKKGGLQGLGLDMAPPAAVGGGSFRLPTTMNLLSGLDAPAEEASVAKTACEPRPSDSVELSLEKAITDPPLKAPAGKQNDENTTEVAGEEAQQLTIFYGGKVVVFDNFPSTKFKDLLQMVNIGDGVDKASSSAAAESLPRPAQNNLSDLPVARRNSLHRFLEKRKGRIIAKAPYQVNSSVDASKKDTGDKSWFWLGQEVAIKQEI